MKKLTTPIDRSKLIELSAGDQILLSGDILVFRDAVHRILCDHLREGKPLPFNLRDEVLYYCGPTPASHGLPVGSAGPTTASRMDPYTAPLFEQGLAVTIGKGERSQEIVELHKKYKTVYMLAVGGTGAFIAQHITKVSVIAFPELGTEAVHRFTVVDMPVIVGIDTKGKMAFPLAPACPPLLQNQRGEVKE